jgi:hypothetical protein
MGDKFVCCSDWEPETRKLNGPLVLAQARNPYLTNTPAFQFKQWVFCPWCGEKIVKEPTNSNTEKG